LRVTPDNEGAIGGIGHAAADVAEDAIDAGVAA